MSRPSAAALVGLASILALTACGAGGTVNAGSASGSPTALGISAGQASASVPTSSSPSAKPSSTPAAAAKDCTYFPANNVWSADVSKLPVAADSAKIIAEIGNGPVHPDFGSGEYEGEAIGFPITEVPAGQPGVHVSFQYASESDPGPYPIPADAQIEGGSSSSGDRHVILLDSSACKVYELYAAYPESGGAWRAGSGAVFDLDSNALRPAGWTSADAAGLSIYAGLVQYPQVAGGAIDHAIRITVPDTRDSYVWPARHAAGDGDSASLPPMGLRLRLKASVDIASLPLQARVIAEAMQKYGVIIADNGSPWYISGTSDSRWNNDALHALDQLTGDDFEVVDTASLMQSPNSGAVAQ